MNWHHWYWWTWPAGIVIGLAVNYVICEMVSPWQPSLVRIAWRRLHR